MLVANMWLPSRTSVQTGGFSDGRDEEADGFECRADMLFTLYATWSA